MRLRARGRALRPALAPRAPASLQGGLEAEQAAEQASYTENLAWRAAWEAEHGRKPRAKADAARPRRARQAQGQHDLSRHPASKARRGRSIQGYNAQVVASPEQVILAADITQQSNDSGQLAPMVRSAGEALRAAGIEESIATVLADGGYWNSPQISDVRDQGIDVLVPIENRSRTAPRTLSAQQGREAQRIEAVLSHPEGQALYRRRQQVVEPVFANIKFIRRADRFIRRGLAACRAEWRLIAATRNLLKLWRAGLAGA